MNHKTLKKTVINYASKNLPLFVAGSPGVGKSWVVKDSAKEMATKSNKKFLEWADLSLEEKLALVSGKESAIERGLDKERAEELENNGFFIFAVLNMVENDLTDIKGVLALTQAGKQSNYADWRPPMLMMALAKKGRHGMLFLDELTQTLPENLSPAFKLVLDHTAGDVKLSRGVTVIGAGNSVSDHSASFEMPMALRNRFGHVSLEAPTTMSWIEWGMGMNLDMRILSYHRSSPDALNMDVGEARKQNLTAYPSARSWHRLSDLINKEQDIPTLGILSDSMVGSNQGNLFKQFIKNSLEVPYENIMKDPTIFSKLDPSTRWGAVSGFVAMFKDNKKIAPRLIEVCASIGDDVGLLIAQGMARLDTRAFASALNSKIGSEFVDKCMKYTKVSLFKE